MDYFNDVLTTFLGLERVSCIAVYAGSESSDFIKNIFICVPKINEGLACWKDMRVSNKWQNFHFWGSYPFSRIVIFECTASLKENMAALTVHWTLTEDDERIVGLWRWMTTSPSSLWICPWSTPWLVGGTSTQINTNHTQNMKHKHIWIPIQR